MKTLLKISKDIKNAEEYLNEYLSNNNLTKDDIFFNIIEEKKGILKNKKYTVEIIEKKDIVNFCRDFVKKLGYYFNSEINSEIKFSDDILNIILISDNNSILIGKNGKNMAAIQYLLRQVINNNIFINIKLNLDISNYKAKKINNLEYQVKKIAKEVLNTKIEAKLDPMNSYERRIVHNAINNFDGLETESVGEEPNRYVIIRLKEK